MAGKLLSEQLEVWLHDHRPKTLANLDGVFKEKSFALIILLLMAIPALPLPTGGVTHVFEIITMLLALEIMIGRRVIWLPKKWQKLKLSGKRGDKFLPALAKRIRWFEKFSKPRLPGLMTDRHFLQVSGLLIFVLAFGAFWSPPFTGLDTLPSMGIVVICLSLIFEDALLYVAGCIIGGLGITISVGIGKGIIELIKTVF